MIFPFSPKCILEPQIYVRQYLDRTVHIRLDLNLNTCAVSSDGNPMAIGTMPLAMHSPVAGLHGKHLLSFWNYHRTVHLHYS